jgi:hypothetical protein
VNCTRHKAPTPMYRVTNPQGSAIAKCNHCSKDVECAYCPKCGHQVCMSCYNKAVAQKGKPPAIGGPPVTDNFII